VSKSIFEDVCEQKICICGMGRNSLSAKQRKKSKIFAFVEFHPFVPSNFMGKKTKDFHLPINSIPLCQATSMSRKAKDLHLPINSTPLCQATSTTKKKKKTLFIVA
jgi:hypothetical protein